jgi:hypothetical protein
MARVVQSTPERPAGFDGVCEERKEERRERKEKRKREMREVGGKETRRERPEALLSLPFSLNNPIFPQSMRGNGVKWCSR